MKYFIDSIFLFHLNFFFLFFSGISLILSFYFKKISFLRGLFIAYGVFFFLFGAPYLTYLHLSEISRRIPSIVLPSLLEVYKEFFITDSKLMDVFYKDLSQSASFLLHGMLLILFLWTIKLISVYKIQIYRVCKSFYHLLIIMIQKFRKK